MRQLLLLVGLAAFCVSGAYAADAIGNVYRVQGAVTGTIDGSANELAAGTSVYLNEIVATGPDARAAVTLADGTILTIGENATLTLDQFVYAPGGENKLHAAVIGAFRFVSGTHDTNRQASVTTPVATIGVRGTDFWGGPIDNTFGVVLLEGAVTVSAGGTSIDVNGVGQGVNIAASPGPITDWPQEKIDRAIATVTFR